MEKNVPTIAKSALQACELLGKQYNVVAKSTINESLAIPDAAAQLIVPGETPVMKVVVIGDGGFTTQTGSDGKTFPTSYYHKPTDSGLFSAVPFLIRAAGSDITNVSGLRNKYRLRKEITIGGQDYIAYYGKVIEDDAIQVALELRTIQDNGTVVATPFVYGSVDNHPVPVLLAPNTPYSTTSQYVAATKKVALAFSAADINELLHVAEIIYNDGRPMTISEIAMCAGVDRPFEIGGNPANIMIESYCTQVMTFLATNFPASSFRNGVNYTFEVGNTEPLFSVAAIA